MSPLKQSQFNVHIPDYPQDGQHLLYNVLARTTIRVNGPALELLQNLPTIPIDTHQQQWLKELEKHGFVVPHALDEGEAYTQRLERAKPDTSYLHVTLSLIQRCNFGCPDCFEDGPESTFDGSIITSAGIPGSIRTDEIIEFMKLECEARHVKKLHFTAYGGEPLLNRRALFDIVAEMNAYCQKQGIRWAFDTITNGALLTRKTVLELKKHGFSQAQITINGNRETHNATRPWRNRKGDDIGTYDIIMQNLESWAGLVHTHVLSWISPFLVEPSYELIDTLADKGLAEKKVRMRFTPISSTYDNSTIQQVSRSYASDPLLLDDELQLFDAMTKLQIHAAKRGLIDDLRPMGTWCSVIRANGQNVTITPNGKIYSCAAFLGRDAQFETGHIHQSERSGLDERMKGFEYPDQCKRCAYLPTCSNCRADALTKTGDLFGANSYQARYELILPQLIKAHYDLHHQKN